MYEKYYKRIIDIVVSFFAILVLFIPIIIFIILIKLEDNGPIFFIQKRIGKQDKKFTKEFYDSLKNISIDNIPKEIKTFNLLKFRTMKISTPHDTPTHLLKDPYKYILKIGAFMRKYSIDETLQLINVLKGDMSLVGPRPALWNQFDLMEEREKYDANLLLPGITGLAQISGRDELEISKKAFYDGEYKKNLSFKLDIKCFLSTFMKVITHEGVKEGTTKKM